MSVPPGLICPACSARLVVESSSSDPVILCAGCGVQFRPNGDWPVTRTSRRAIASFILGIILIGGLCATAILSLFVQANIFLAILSIGGLCAPAVPALFLGLWALRDIQHPRHAEILSGKRLAIAGASLGALFSLAMFVLPMLLLIPLQREGEVAALSRSARTHMDDNDWTAAATEYERILKLDPEDEMEWLRAATVHALSGEEEYRRLCDEILSRFGETEDPVVAERIAKACLLLPPKNSHLEVASRLAEQAATQDPDHEFILWFDVTRGLARYRRGDFGGAVESCKKCQSGDPSNSAWRRAALAYFIQALAHFQSGENEAAREALERGRTLVDGHPDLGSAWHDSLIAKILLDEVEGLVASADPDTTAQ